MAKKNGVLTSNSMIRISIGTFFIILGIMGISPALEESVFSLTRRYGSLEVFFGIVELVCGIFIIASMFLAFSRKVKYGVSAVILVFWIARVFVSQFVFGFVMNQRGLFFLPSLSVWLLVLSCELIIASCLWMNLQNYRD